VRAIIFQGKRYDAHTWKDAMLALFELLRSQYHSRFEETALTLTGRKRPYISRDRQALRVPQLIPSTKSLYVETNLSANYIAKLCYTLITKMGYETSALIFEIEQ
jgi:negative regulator of replication initiation